MLRGTPFHSRTGALCQAQNWRRWAGYVVAGSYELTHEREYYAIRSSAGLIDVSPLYKYLIHGRDAARLLDRVVTRDVTRCAVGQVMYTPWCDSRGKVLDDGTLARLEEQTFRLTAAEPNLRWLWDNATGLDVSVDDVTDATAALALQGPLSREILRGITDCDLDSLRFFRVAAATIQGVRGPIECSISRTGYTGDLGYEIWIDKGDAEPLWDTLLEHGAPFGITPAGMLALDMVRIEAGLLLIDVDYVPARKALIEEQKSSPFELGLGWTVRLDKNYFVGCDALRDEKKRGSRWELRGLVIDWNSLEEVYGEFALPPQLPGSAWRTSVPVYSHGRQVGYATSGCWSPVLKKYIALAHLETTAAQLGNRLTMEVTVEHRRRRADAEVVKTPFFDPVRKRK